jgi:hypothetical protein
MSGITKRMLFSGAIWDQGLAGVGKSLPLFIFGETLDLQDSKP